MWNFGGRVIGQCISYVRLLMATEGLNWMWCCSMGSNQLQMTLVMLEVVHGHNEGTMMYVGLKNGCHLIWGNLCAFFQYHTMHML
jgi:hypothetical protein